MTAALKKGLGGATVEAIQGFFKLDRKKLQQMAAESGYGSGGREQSYVAPETALERHLCEAFAAVLKLDASGIGVHDSFFDLGGHSLLVMRLTKLIGEPPMSRDVSVGDVFATPSVKGLADKLGGDSARSTTQLCAVMRPKGPPGTRGR